MKINSFVNFESPQDLRVGDMIVISGYSPRIIPYLFLVTGRLKDGEYESYGLVDLNSGDVLFETQEEDITELWEYLDRYVNDSTYNVLFIGNNNIEISFKNIK